MNNNQSENDSDDSDGRKLKREELEIYRQSLAWLFVWTSVIVGILTVTLSIMEKTGHRPVTILMLVALAGALGALFSALTRLYSLSQLPSALILIPPKRPKSLYLLVFSLVPPVVGMIGAVFFYVFMQSEIITSNVFVKFVPKGADDCGSLRCLLSYSPEYASDYAKAVVWGFVAGFSERLVPDVLARLEKGDK